MSDKKDRRFGERRVIKLDEAIVKKVIMDSSDVDKTIKKLKRLRKLLKEANSLTKELASETKKLHIKCQID